MTSSVALALIGFGVGVLLIADERHEPRPVVLTLRERALEAQRLSARVSKHARDLAAQWSAEQDRLASGGQR